MPMNSDDDLSSHFDFIYSGFLEMLLLCWSTQSHHDLLTSELCSAQYISNSLPVGVTSCGKCLNRCTFPKGLTSSSPHSIASRGLLSFLIQKHYLTTFGPLLPRNGLPLQWRSLIYTKSQKTHLLWYLMALTIKGICRAGVSEAGCPKEEVKSTVAWV